MLAKLKSGGAAVVPGKPDESDLIFRIETDDPEAKMPPKKSGKQLTAQQIETASPVGRAGGVVDHALGVRAAPQDRLARRSRTRPGRGIRSTASSWPGSKPRGLHPSAEAEPTTLIRRVYLDLTGLPPTPSEVDAFLADRSDNAYEKLVDRLLDSPRYGEHMARFWLDAARYGDTHGLHLDNYREIWPYRDWVIKAFNANKPFDQFVVEQLAGDLLPNPTLDQLIATGYNRCHVSTSEGGSIEEEVYVRNVVDQVDTNGTVFLGMTIGCARCHDHKYDPVRMKDYYQLFAFFNNIDGPAARRQRRPVGADRQGAVGRAEGRAGQLADKKIAALRQTIAAEVTQGRGRLRRKGRRRPGRGRRAERLRLDRRRPAPGRLAPGRWPVGVRHPARSSRCQRTGVAADHVPRGSNSGSSTTPARKLKVGEGDTLFAYVYLDPLNPPKEIMLQWHTGGAWSHRAYWGENVIAWGKDGTPERLRIGDLPATGQVGPARGRGEEAGPEAGHADRRLGVHSAGRDGLLGPGRDRDLDSAGRPGLRLADSLDPGPQGRRRRRAAGRPQGRSSRSSDRSEPRPRRRSCWPSSSSRDTPGPVPVFDPLHAAARPGRARA